MLWGGAVIGGGGRVEEFGALGVTGYDGDLVCVVEGEVGVDEDEEVCYRFGEGEGVGEESPGVGVRVEDYGQQGRGRFCIAIQSASLCIQQQGYLGADHGGQLPARDHTVGGSLIVLGTIHGIHLSEVAPADIPP